MWAAGLLLLVALLPNASGGVAGTAPKSQPVAAAQHLPTSKFTERDALKLEDVLFGTDASGVQKSECPIGVELVWQHEMTTGIYQTPVIDQLLNDGGKQIIVPTFKRNIHVLDSDGHRIPGMSFPVKDGAYFHTSPVMVDFDQDGTDDFVWVSVNGEIYVVNGRQGGERKLAKTMFLPKLRVRKKWYVGLDEMMEEENEHTHEQKQQKQQKQQKELLLKEQEGDNDPSEVQSHADAMAAKGVSDEEGEEGSQKQESRRAQQTPADDDGDALPGPQLYDGLTDEARESLSLFFEDAEHPLFHSDEDPTSYERTKNHVWVDAHVLATPVVRDVDGDGFPDLIASVSYFFDEDDYMSSPHLFNHLDVDVDIRNYIAGGVVAFSLRDNKVIWSEHLDLTTQDTKARAYIYSSPTVVDLDGDGGLEVIVGTSLGFIYAMHAHNGELLANFPLVMSEIQAQIAVEDVNGDGLLEMIALDRKGNVLCFDREGKEVWEAQISGFAAQSATFGDVDGDGKLDVVVGTLAGTVWALSGTDGSVLKNFPIKTGARIIAPIMLTNLNSRTPRLRRSGETKRVKAAFDKLNADEDKEVEEEESQEEEEEQDEESQPMPKREEGKGLPESLARDVLRRMHRRQGLHLVFPSFDGHVYIVDGASACVNKIDIGEHAYGMVLADDVLGTGRMDLVVTTMNGNVFLFATQSPYNPLKAWSSQTQGLNGFTARMGWLGVAVSKSTRQHGEVTGRHMQVEFYITDHRPDVPGSRRYHVTISCGNTVLFSQTYTEPGAKIETIPTMETPGRFVLKLAMENEHQQVFTDSWTMSLNEHYYRLLKWILVLPFAFMAFMLVYFEPKGHELPSSLSSQHKHRA